MRHLNLKAGEWSGPVIEEEILTGPRLFLRNAGEAMQVRGPDSLASSAMHKA
jgi:hypothetical protein